MCKIHVFQETLMSRVHKEFKNINEFTRICNELGEFWP